MMEKIKKIIQFIKEVAQDERIPERDKKMILVMVALVVSPIDFIPDWIPIIGILDDIFIMALVLDYFFTVLDSQVLLSHYPFGMKSFIALKKTSKMISWITPEFVRDRIWKYKPPVY
jgi:uncharacterized membrane protein YkvA (DUF1232 family)